MIGIGLGVAVCLFFGALAIVGVETGRPGLVRAGKPLATLSLLLVLGLPPWDHFRTLVGAGILLSLIGDVALIGEGDREFLIGTVAFLLAHVLYSLAFGGAAASVAGGRGYLSPVTLAVVLASGALVALLWHGAGKMRPAIVIYALAITVMVSTASAAARFVFSGRAAIAVAVGSTLFYLSDASLAWNRFRSPLRHRGLVTLGTYWLGQLGIALAARWQG